VRQSIAERLVRSGAVLAEGSTRALGHKGYWHALSLLAKIAPNRVTHVRVNGVNLEISMRDPYWLRIVAPGYEYEVEVLELIAELSVLPFDFVDAGANLGFWTAFVGKDSSRRRIVAIEPNPETFAILQRNTQQLEGTVVLLNAGLVTEPADSVELYVPKRGQRHTDGSVVKPRDKQRFQCFTVQAVTLDLLLSEYLSESECVLLKLDVEGLEKEILRQANNLKDSRIAIVYEDHGSDSRHEASAALVGSPFYTVFFLSPGKGPIPIQDLRILDRLKPESTRGYNLFAVPNTGIWANHMDRAFG